jgi:hypothetical protein
MMGAYAVLPYVSCGWPLACLSTGAVSAQDTAIQEGGTAAGVYIMYIKEVKKKIRLAKELCDLCFLIGPTEPLARLDPDSRASTCFDKLLYTCQQIYRNLRIFNLSEVGEKMRRTRMHESRYAKESVVFYSLLNSIYLVCGCCRQSSHQCVQD